MIGAMGGAETSRGEGPQPREASTFTIRGPGESRHEAKARNPGGGGAAGSEEGKGGGGKEGGQGKKRNGGARDSRTFTSG